VLGSLPPNLLFLDLRASHFLYCPLVRIHYRATLSEEDEHRKTLIERRFNMGHASTSEHDPGNTPDLGFSHLLYRFLFFDWLFVDMTKAKDLFERHAAWQHNKRMRRHLPTYLRRWSVISVLDFGLGWLFEQILNTSLVAAWFFTWFCVMLAGLVVISVLWLFLSRPDSL
jgi:hypothetical protein